MKTNYQKEIISRIRKLRENNNVSQAQIADFLGISYGQVGNIESARTSHKYTLAQLYRLCEWFGISITTLFLEDEIADVDTKIKTLFQNIIAYEN